MHLTVTTPQAVLLDLSDVTAVRAEDASGAFGILPGHVDFLTVLSPSVLTYRQDGVARYIAVRGGVLTVRGGQRVAVATRQAIPGEDLEHVEQMLLDSIAQDAAEERAGRRHAARLHVTVARLVERYLRAGTEPHPPPNHGPAGEARP